MKILKVYFKIIPKVGNFSEPSWLPDATGTCRGVKAEVHEYGVKLIASDELLLIPWHHVDRVYYHESAIPAPAGKPRNS